MAVGVDVGGQGVSSHRRHGVVVEVQDVEKVVEAHHRPELLELELWPEGQAHAPVVDLVATLEKPATKEDINNAMRQAAEGPLKGVLEYCVDPIVSCDIVGNPHSSIFDALSTMVIGDTVKLVSWYDNEFGYSNRVVDLIEFANSLG